MYPKACYQSRENSRADNNSGDGPLILKSEELLSAKPSPTSSARNSPEMANINNNLSICSSSSYSSISSTSLPQVFWSEEAADVLNAPRSSRMRIRTACSRLNGDDWREVLESCDNIIEYDFPAAALFAEEEEETELKETELDIKSR